MERKNKVMVSCREKAVPHQASQSFQADIVPNVHWEGREIYTAIARHSGLSDATIEMAVVLIESFIRDELAHGNRIDFNLVSFMPRLSGALSARDADPESEGVTARGSVKARRELVTCVRGKLELVNELSNVRPHILAVCDLEAKRPDIIAPGHVIQIVGEDVQIVTSRPDEGVWLEKRAHGRQATAEIIETSAAGAKVIFREVPPCGKYTLVLGTRCGHSEEFRLRRCLADVQVAAG